MSIFIYSPDCNDFTTNGLGELAPLECVIEEQAAGMYELTLVHPIDESLRWAQLIPGCIIRAPAPVRECPLYEAPAAGGSVTITRQVWEVYGTTHGLYLRSGPGMDYPRIGKRYNGDEIIELEDASDPWKKVCVAVSGAVGYMSTKYLRPLRSVTEVIEPAKPAPGGVLQIGQSRDQLFRIYAVEQDSAAAAVTARAMHVFYDEAGNLIDSGYEITARDVNDVLSDIEARLALPPRVRFQSVNLSGEITGDFSHKSPVEACLDPDSGLIAQTRAMLVRDNWDAYLLPDMVRDRGVTIRRGKNLLGVEVTSDASAIATRIIPVGRSRNGDPLYLDGANYVDSPRSAEYPIPRARRIEYDVQTGENGFATDAAVRAELRRLAQAEFEQSGADLPAYGMDVDFVLLGNTDEYANYASLQAVHLYDTVTVIDELLGLRARVRVTAYKWNCLTRQYEGVTLGEIQDLRQRVYSYNLPDGGVSGAKIMNNSLGGAALRSASIEYAKISVAAVEQLCANAITALTARIQEIVAQKLTADELYASYADLIALKAGTINADNIETDALAAELARITVLAAGTATFDKATIQHLVAQAMNLEYGVAGQVFIQNLAVEYAQMVGAAIGELCIRASDGNYYLLDVGPDGTVSAAMTTVSDGEIAAGQTSGGKVILETNITASNLNAGNLLATYALINQIDAARIDVDQLFAREAFIALLRTTKIIGDQSITMIAQRASRSFRQAEMPVDGVRPGDTWRIPETGETYQAEDAGKYNLRIYLDEGGNLQYEMDVDDGSVSLAMQGYDLALDGVVLQCDESGNFTDPIRWVLVRDEGMLSKDEFQHCVRVAPDGLHVGAQGSTGEVVIDHDSVDVVLGGRAFSSFAANYVEFGNYQLRRTADGGLAFKMR